MRKIVKRSLALGLSLILSMSGNFWINSIPCSMVVVNAAVEKINQKVVVSRIDILDYESNPSAAEFAVNDVAGFEKLAELVNSGKESFKGKIVKLTTDLKYDKTVKNNHKVIGRYTGYSANNKYFEGAFDGQFHTISGINLYTESEETLGLFGATGSCAKISKMILEDSDIVSGKLSHNNGYEIMGIGGIVGRSNSPLIINECTVGMDVKITAKVSESIGGIIGYAASSPFVDKCINYATVSGQGGVGGIVGTADLRKGYIKRSINFGTIKGGSITVDIGGIAGGSSSVLEEPQEGIVECCNMGQIIMEGRITSSSSIGGISGYCSKVINCYNAGDIIPKIEDYIYVGGISGRPDGGWDTLGSIQNIYSVGKVKNSPSGAIASTYGVHIWNASNCYWLSGTADVGIYEKLVPNSPKQDTSSVFEYGQSQMQSKSFIDELNANSKAMGYGEVWAADTKNINNGYPILKNVPYTVDDLINGSGDDKDNIYVPDEKDDPIDTTQVSHFYEDHNYSAAATNSTIRVYANCGTVKISEKKEKKNYKRCIIYTDITPSYIYTENNKGVVKPSIGKVVVGITSSNAKPTLVKGKIIDKTVSKIASASIKNGQITVTAKSQPGKVYLWAIDTGRAGESACIPVTVKAAPTATNIYAVPDTDSSFTYGKTKQFKSGKISVGESAKVYVYPTYKENGAVQKAKKVSYTASVAAKSADYFSVKQSDSNPLCYEISAKSLKNGKSVTGAITFTCSLNGKKVVFKATAINQVTGISTANVSGMTRESDSSFKIKASDSEKTTGTFEMRTSCSSNTDATTDILKIYAMGSADGYDTAQFEAGKVKITKKRSDVQSKISMKPAKDKKTVIVTAAKGTKPVTAYFLAVYNNVNSGLKKGYMVISVTAE